MGRSSLGAILLLAALTGTGTPSAAELCEGCWETGGRVSYLAPSSDSGTNAAAGVGAQAGFRFKPFWSVHFALDRTPSRISDGPDEALTLLSIAFEYTFRASREQRTRPFMGFVAGFTFDQVASGVAPGGSTSVRSSPASDNSLMYGLAAGGLTTLSDRVYLRYEGRLLKWSTFGIGTHASDLLVGIVVKLGE